MRLRQQASVMRSVEAEHVARRRIDPTNEARRANLVRQHGLSMREHPLLRVLPMSRRDVAKTFFGAGLFVFALVGVMAVGGGL